MEKPCEDSEVPLLAHGNDDVSLYDSNLCGQCRGLRRGWLKENALMLLACLLLLYISTTETIRMTQTSPFNPREGICKPVNRLSLVDELLQYEERMAWEPPKGNWALPPSEELDDTWDDLLYAQNVRVSPDEVKYLGLDTGNGVQINGGDYIGVIGVYHHLHCLDNIRRLIHWDDHYAPMFQNWSDFGIFSKPHSDHCFDSIRQALMCNAPTEIHLIDWVDPEEDPAALWGMELRPEASSTCLRWESLDSWARERALVPGEFTYRPGPWEESRVENEEAKWAHAFGPASG